MWKHFQEAAGSRFPPSYSQPDDCSPGSKSHWDQHTRGKGSKQDGAEDVRSLIITKRPSGWDGLSESPWVGWRAWALTNHGSKLSSTNSACSLQGDPSQPRAHPAAGESCFCFWFCFCFWEGEFGGHSTVCTPAMSPHTLTLHTTAREKSTHPEKDPARRN